MAEKLYKMCSSCDGDGTIAYGEVNEFERACGDCRGIGFVDASDEIAELETALAAANNAANDAREGCVRMFERIGELEGEVQNKTTLIELLKEQRSRYWTTVPALYRAIARTRKIAEHWRGVAHGEV